MNTTVRAITTALVATAITGAALVTAAGPASAKDTDIWVRTTCSKGSVATLKAKPDDGRIEVELEVDSNRNGQAWNVGITDNGASVFAGRRTTVAPSGSFSIERLVANRAGTDRFVARATTASTGETCTVSLNFAG